jgi:hypothetical protein
MRGGGMPHRIIAISRSQALPTNGQSWLGYDWAYLMVETGHLPS